MGESDTVCEKLGIPAHLHSCGRPGDFDFTPTEALYRRIPPSIELPDEEPVPEIFTTRQMSVNRERYSNAPDDVLYNIVDGQHYNDFGIASMTVQQVESIEKVHPSREGVTYGLCIVHKPEPCMYPHCLVVVTENGEPLKDVKPSSVKTFIKDCLASVAQIVKKPVKQAASGEVQ